MEDIMSEIKKGEISRVTFTNEQLHRYFPTELYTRKNETGNSGNIEDFGQEEYWETVI